MNRDAARLVPPRAAELFVRLAVRDPKWREVTLGDLGEEFHARARLTGRRARLWYWRQAGTLLAASMVGAVTAFFQPAGGRLMTTLFREVRFAVRSLARQPLMALLVIATLALGLGANAATFGMIDALALRPFTFEGVDRLVILSENSAADPYPQEAVSPGNYRDLAARDLRSIDGLAAFEWWDVNIAGGDEPERVQGHRVPSTFFPMLGIQPAHGRFFTRESETWGSHRQAVISDGLWRRRFGADPAVVGRTVRINGEAFDLVGVAPGGFDFPNATEVWLPLAFDAEDAADRASHYLTVMGHLRSSASQADAEAELDVVYGQIKAAYPDATRDREMVVRSFTAGMVDYGLPRLLLLWQVAALLVLVIGSVNVANLLLARGAERQRELAVRLAIGAGRGQVMRQLLIESVVLAVVSVPAALVAAWALFGVIQSAMPAALLRFLPGWTDMGVDLRVAAVTFATAVGAAFLFGLLPALQVSRPQLTSALRDGGRSASAGVGRIRLRRALVVAQIAIVLPLLVMSGLAAIGAQRFGSGPQGYDPEGVVRLRLRLAEASYPDDESRRLFGDRLLEEAATIARVGRAATTTVTPAATSNMSRGIVVDGVPPAEGSLPTANYRAVSAGYFDVMRIPIERGRGIAEGDVADGQRVAVVSESMARRHWPNGSAIGQRIKVGRDATVWYTVVGVTGDTIDDWFANRHTPTMYVPVRQAPHAQMFLVARTSGDPADLVPELRAAIARVDPTQPAFDITTMRNAIHERTTGIRFIGAMMAGFGGLALLLAAFGIYGVMAHYVAQRRQEIGVRMALGATRRDVLRLTLGQSAKLSAIGIAAGLVMGVLLARLMENVLFGVVAIEPWLFVAITVGLAGIAILASAIPARHAMRIDPMGALRE